MTVIELRNQDEWYEATLAKRSLAWNKTMKIKLADNDNFNFDKAIEKEELIIRSFMNKVRDQQAA